MFKLILVPVMAGLGYEVIRLAARFEGNIFLRLFVLPGLLIQFLTTREPDKKQLQAAIEALRQVV